MIKLQQWMKKGAKVVVSGYPGTIQQVITCRIGGDTAPAGYLGEDMVMRMYVQNDGVLQAWPVNPANVDQLTNIRKTG